MECKFPNIHVITLCTEPTVDFEQFFSHSDYNLSLYTPSFQGDSKYFQNSTNNISTGLKKIVQSEETSLLYTFLNIFEASFPIKYVSIGKIKNDWIAQGIKICCKGKRSLYIYGRNSNDPNTRAFYIKYCKILNNVIKEAKKQHYCRLIAKSDNKIKTTWNIVKRETGKIHLAEQMPSLLINNEKVKGPVTVANAFNIFFF
jgi:hypothetical protein